MFNNDNNVPDFLKFLSFISDRKVSNDQIESFCQLGKIFNNMLIGFKRSGMPDNVAYDLAKTMIVEVVLLNLKGDQDDE